MGKHNVVYTVKLPLVLKRNQGMSLARKCVELEIIMLNEISQSHKDSISCFLSHVETREK